MWKRTLLASAAGDRQKLSGQGIPIEAADKTTPSTDVKRITLVAHLKPAFLLVE
jgi:hypothetical protein